MPQQINAAAELSVSICLLLGVLEHMPLTSNFASQGHPWFAPPLLSQNHPLKSR